jgi:hypothetical protein
MSVAWHFLLPVFGCHCDFNCITCALFSIYHLFTLSPLLSLLPIFLAIMLQEECSNVASLGFTIWLAEGFLPLNINILCVLGIVPLFLQFVVKEH